MSLRRHARPKAARDDSPAGQLKRAYVGADEERGFGDDVNEMKQLTTGMEWFVISGDTTAAFFSEDPIPENSEELICPLAYFAFLGGVTMCRYLIKNGASGSTTAPRFFPIAAAAAADKNSLKIMKLLCSNGGMKDLKRDILERKEGGRVSRHPPFCAAYLRAVDLLRIAVEEQEFSRVQDKIDVLVWMMLNGALCADDGVKVDPIAARRGFISHDLSFKSFSSGQAGAARSLLWRRIESLWEVRTSFLLFLNATLSRESRKRCGRGNVTTARSNAASVRGLGGPLKTIASFLGVVFGEEATRLRQMVKLLPDVFKDCHELDQVTPFFNNETGFEFDLEPHDFGRPSNADEECIGRHGQRCSRRSKTTLRLCLTCYRGKVLGLPRTVRPHL